MINSNDTIEISDFNTPLYIGIRKHGHRVLAVSCSYCGNFYTVREDIHNTGRKKSCGCLQREAARKTGLSRKGKRKHNKIHIPYGKDYVKVYFYNYDGFFLVSIEDYPFISQYCWSALKNGKNRVEPYTLINGRLILLSRFVMNTPPDLECDHISGCVLDARKCNLRNCTHLQNLFNRERSQGKAFLDPKGKYRIKGLLKVDTKNLSFDTEEEANANLDTLREQNHGEYAYPASQEVVRKNETYEFSEDRRHYCNSTLDKIEMLPKKNILNIILGNIRRDALSGKISESKEIQELLKLQRLAKEFSL